MTCFKCKECGADFPSIKSLHAHIKKHDLILGDYYVKHYPRYNKLTGKQLPFKNYHDYFEKDFSNYSQLVEWCQSAPKEEVKDYLVNVLKNRIIKKNLSYAPNTVELFTSGLPPMDVYKYLFGSYSDVCKMVDAKPLFNSPLPKEFHNDCRNVKIYIDTREQQPLKFNNSETLKLDVGDYAVSGDDYAYTYVDRKSFSDFCSTMTQEYKRFARELQRCRDLGAYLFIVTETNLYKMDEKNRFNPKRYALDYVFHNMRELQHEFKDCCQFIFSGNRSNSQILIPKLLILGKKVWNVDIQYYLDTGEMNYFERSAK